MISIAMCTCNGAAWLRQQLVSLWTQTRRPAEIVVCDDASTDETRVLLQQLAKDSPIPMHLFMNPSRLGASANFQQAIQKCNGELIALCDQDDIWHPHKLDVMAEQLDQKSESALAMCDARLVDEQCRPLGETLWEAIEFTPERQRQLSTGRPLPLLSFQNYATGATMMIRRQFLSTALPFSPYWVHDGWLCLILSAIAPCELIRQTLVDYRQHSAQQLGAVRRQSMNSLAFQQMIEEPYFHREALRWSQAHHHLLKLRNRLRHPGDLRFVRQRAAFDRSRVHLRRHPNERWELVARHWLAGDYHNYARGIYSAVADALSPVNAHTVRE